jgi:hypothetical protein
MICDYAAVARIEARGQRCSIYVRRTRINGVVIAKNDPLMRQLPKRGRVFLAHEIGSHSVPHNYKNVSRSRRRFARGYSAHAIDGDEPEQDQHRALAVRTNSHFAAISEHKSLKKL